MTRPSPDIVFSDSMQQALSELAPRWPHGVLPFDASSPPKTAAEWAALRWNPPLDAPGVTSSDPTLGVRDGMASPKPAWAALWARAQAIQRATNARHLEEARIDKKRQADERAKHEINLQWIVPEPWESMTERLQHEERKRRRMRDDHAGTRTQLAAERHYRQTFHRICRELDALDTLAAVQAYDPVAASRWPPPPTPAS